MSGRNSVEQDEALVELMHRTPQAPIKMSFSKGSTPHSAQRRRQLFAAESPTHGLGHMSPLSSSVESLQSVGSPSFSPNGRMTSPQSTPKTSRTPHVTRTPERKEIPARSILFPDSMSKRRQSPRLSSATKKVMATVEKSVGESPTMWSPMNTPRSARRTPREIISETSPSSVGTPWSVRRPGKFLQESFEEPTSSPPFIKPIAEDSFYGPPKPSVFSIPKPPGRKTLVIDSIVGRRSRVRHDSDRSFVSGGGVKRPRSSSGSASRSHKQRKTMIPGVWHGLKKPKTMKKSAPKPKPVISPNTRIAKMGQAKKVPVMKKSKARALFVEKPRMRLAKVKRNRAREDNDSDIIDSFPEPLIKRKKLPSTPVKEPEPDEAKKFLKHGAYRKATFTLHDNVRLEFKNGSMRMKSPKKPRPVRTRKLHVATQDIIDFDEPEPQTGQLQESVDTILRILQDTPPKRARQMLSEEELINILDSPSTQVKFVQASPDKIGLMDVKSSPQRTLLRNLSNLNISNETGLGNIISQSTDLLNGEMYCDIMDNAQSKLYPVFQKENWVCNTANVSPSMVQKDDRRKNVLLREDQYLLDAGQKSIGVVQCRECGVMYQKGDYLDEVAHRNAHNHISELRFMGWKDERVVARYPDGRVIVVTANDPKTWQQKATKIVGVVDLDLGFSENSLKWTPDKKVFLFINEKIKQVVGCLVAETCTKGYRMYAPIDGIEIDTCQRDSTPCKLGISRIWTALAHRRKGIASRLVSSARRLAGDADPDDVAFSIPTPAGKGLARSVIGREDFKVYGFLTA